MSDYRNPLTLLNELKAVPDLSKWVDATIEHLETVGVDVREKWCFLPTAAWLAIVQQSRPDLDRFDQSNFAMFLSAVGTWRYSQGIYRFDPDLYEELLHSESSGKMPSEVLKRLPEWSVYIETPGLICEEMECYGVFVLLDDDRVNNVSELRLYAITSQTAFNTPSPDGAITFALPFADGVSIDESYELWLNRLRENAKKLNINEDQVIQSFDESRAGLVEFAKKVLNLVLYICSEEPEIVDRKTPDWLPTFPRPKKTKGVVRYFPAKRPHVYDVGRKLGEELRKAKEKIPTPPTGRTVISHLRRAHWHSFWTGKRIPGKETEQKLIVKWLPPIFVHGGNKI